DVKDKISGAVIGLFLLDHPAVCLVNTEATHAEVPDGLAEMAGEVFLPRFAVADLVAQGEAVAIRVDPARLIDIGVRRAHPVRLHRRDGGTPVNPVPRHVVAEAITCDRIELGP